MGDTHVRGVSGLSLKTITDEKSNRRFVHFDPVEPKKRGKT
jgi:hypothetical protein